MSADIVLWTAEDTVQMLPLVVAGIALALLASQSERRTSRRQLRLDLQAAENRCRHLEHELRRVRWDNDQLRGVRSPAHHLGVARRKARRPYRPPAALPAWLREEPHHLTVPSWPLTAETAAVALALDPAPGPDTEPFPFGALIAAGADR